MTEVVEKRIAEIETRVNATFCGPWEYTSFEVECGGDSCEIDACIRNPKKHKGDDHEVLSIEAPDEYPETQCVAQIHVPGLETFARPHGEFIAHSRADVPWLIEELRKARKEAVEAEKRGYESGRAAVEQELRSADRAALFKQLVDALEDIRCYSFCEFAVGRADKAIAETSECLIHELRKSTTTI
jgi:hypothetical protein